jgi:hypothetical protein
MIDSQPDPVYVGRWAEVPIYVTERAAGTELAFMHPDGRVDRFMVVGDTVERVR